MKIFTQFFFVFVLLLTNQIIAQQWWNVGSVGFSASKSDHISVAMDGSGTPYVVYYDPGNSDEVMVMKYNGNSWVNIGSPGYTRNGDRPSIAIDRNGTPYVAYSDYHYVGSAEKATVKKYNGSSWITVGSADFSANFADYISIAIDGNGTPYVAYADGYPLKATVEKYYGGSWQVVGSADFSAGTADYTSIAIDGSGTPYVVYQDGANSYKATVMKFNGSIWEAVGSAGFSSGIAGYTSIAIDGSGTPYVAYQDGGHSNEATVMKYNGSNWVAVGSAGFSSDGAYSTSIAIDGSGTPYVAYSDYGNSAKATVEKFYDGNWQVIGSAGFSASEADYTSIVIAPNGIPIVAYEDLGNSYKATVMKYSVNQSDPLPVELSSFSASATGSEVELNWETATEVNNYGFGIERSQKLGVSSQNSNWTQIGFVRGNGNSNSPKQYSFVDKNPLSGKVEYRLKQIDNDGKFKYSDVVTVKINALNKAELLQNNPNPFNPSTSIKFYIPNTAKVKISIYDLLGRKVKTLINQQETAGYHIIYWNGKDGEGNNVASGVYLYRLVAGNFVQTKKMVLLK